MGLGHKPHTQICLYPSHDSDNDFFCGLGISSDISIYVSSALKKINKIEHSIKFSVNPPTTS